jgi:hypothetical protein
MWRITVRKLQPLGIALVFSLVLLPRGAYALDIQSDILQPARAHLGSGYCRGGISSPCFDCSGFVTSLYARFVPDLPRISRDMARYGRAVDRELLQPGDLVFFATGGSRESVTHVGIYVGQDSVIHAISDGPSRGVALTPLSARYWRTRYHSARRVLPQPTAETGWADGAAFARGVYTGEIDDGEPSGRGRMRMNNGDRYEGEFRDGVFHGSGSYTWVSGDRYEGTFADGQMHGEGTFFSTDGVTIRGRWDSGEYVSEPDIDTTTAAAAEREASRETYIDSRDSPWETWDGVVVGDFYAWQEQERNEFEEWRRNN